MAADWSVSSNHERSYQASQSSNYSIEEFDVYKTRESFYLIGSDRDRVRWKVLEIKRSEPSILKVNEDPKIYTEEGYRQRLAELNDRVEFVTKAYGIVGFIKFLEPYYMVLITERHLLGNIQGHSIYGISKSLLVTIPNLVKPTHSYAENRYIKLFNSVDLSKGFFYSYTYRVMWNLQRITRRNEASESMPYDDMFVWNSFISEKFRDEVWTVALAYGFFNQVKLTYDNRNFVLTLIARRSRHFAGTRYFKRGVNDKGSVANDVETEQIVHEEKTEQISSIVQLRGSIPLYWSQDISVFDPKPDIKLHENGPPYNATKLHFQDLVERYENCIFVLNLAKNEERKPRESILSKAFETAIDYLNKNLDKNEKITFLPCDMNLISPRKDDLSGELMSKAFHVLESTGFYYSGKEAEKHSSFSGDVLNGSRTNVVDGQHHANQEFQCGVLRTNCIDCIDRTNVAQYALGLAALGLQLKKMGLYSSDKIKLTSKLAITLMEMYRKMGDAVALQYGGSSAHSRFFSQWQGTWSVTIQTMSFVRSIERHYNNSLLDGEKQDAINIFLGKFRPEVGKPGIWELGSSSRLQIRKVGEDHDLRLSLKRSQSYVSMQEQAVTSPGSTEDVPPTNPVKETASLRRSVLDSSKRGITISEAELKKCLDDVGGLDSIIITSRSSPDPPLSFIGEISENISGDNVNVEQPSSSGNCNSSEDEAQERCGCHLILTWIAGYLYRISCGGDDVASSVKSKSKLADYSRIDVFQDLTTLLMGLQYKLRSW